MSLRLSILASVLSTVFLINAAPANASLGPAFCTPDPSTGTKCLIAPPAACQTLGATTMDGDHQNLIACMGSASGHDCAAGQCSWKAMTSSTATVEPRQTYTALTLPQNFVNATKNSDISYNYVIPAKATHLSISSACQAIGIDGSTKIKAYFTPSAEPMTFTTPQSLCAASASSGETNRTQSFDMFPVPKGVTTITFITTKEKNVDDRTASITVVPLQAQ